MSENEYAFPDAVVPGSKGLTKREYEMIAYRAAALQGLIRVAGQRHFEQPMDGIKIAEDADKFARATFAAAHAEDKE